MSLSEEFQKRMAVRPDQWTLAWWEARFAEIQKGYRGATHASNCAVASCEDVRNAFQELLNRVHALEADRAKIGELQARVEKMAAFLEADRAKIGELQARVERMAAFLSKLKNGTEAEKTKVP